jgi:hypothetical protein
MEVLLNLAWAFCSLSLFFLWTKSNTSNPAPRRTQLFALAMVVLLLLPVISLSDDLLAMQGAAETDMSLRRAQVSDNTHASPASTPFGLPEQIAQALTLGGYSRILSQETAPAEPMSGLGRALDSRPPPSA